MPSAKYYEYNGERLSAKEWSRRLGGKDHLVRDRVTRGWPLSEALTIPVRIRADGSTITGHAGIPFTHEGITDSLSGWSKRSGIPQSTLHGRIKSGLSISEALRQ